MIASGEWIVFRGQGFDPAYLRHVLMSDPFHAQFMQTVAGVGGSLLRARPAQVASIRIPFPDIREQQRIAAILDKADAIQRKRQETIRLLQELRSSSFLRLFGDPVANPKKWPDETFDAHIVQIQYGPRFFNQPYTETGPRIVRITDLDHNGGLDFEAMPRMEVSEEDKRNYCLQPGDLILARSGATVGKTALIEQRAPECIAGAYFIRLRFGNGIHPRYAQMVLSSRSVQAIIANQSRQSAQQNFNGPAIRRLPLPRPPYDLQEKFVQTYDHLTRLLNLAEVHQAACADLFNALVQRAFCGEV
jgi:type I restriction enzyme S subunit